MKFLWRGGLGEIEYENIFIDGTKIEAYANKYTFVWKKTTLKNELRMQEKARVFLATLNKEFNTNLPLNESAITVEIMQKAVDFKGKRKTELQRATETMEEFLEKQKKYDYYNELFDGRNSFSKTDTDATFMHMKEDHMRNSQLKPGYNVQIGVEAEYIVGVAISSERSDQMTLIPFLEKLIGNLHKKYLHIIADAGYESEENYVYLHEHGQNVEGAFVVLKEDHGFRRFVMRGKKNVKTEFLLLAFGFNINKLHNKIQQDRCGCSLHEIKVA